MRTAERPRRRQDQPASPVPGRCSVPASAASPTSTRPKEKATQGPGGIGGLLTDEQVDEILLLVFEEVEQKIEESFDDSKLNLLSNELKLKKRI